MTGQEKLTAAQAQGVVLRDIAASLGIAGAKPTAVADARGSLKPEEQKALDASLNGMSDYGKNVELSDMQLNKRINDYLAHAGPASLREFRDSLAVNLSKVYADNGITEPVGYATKPSLRRVVDEVSKSINPQQKIVTSAGEGVRSSIPMSPNKEPANPYPTRTPIDDTYTSGGPLSDIVQQLKNAWHSVTGAVPGAIDQGKDNLQRIGSDLKKNYSNKVQEIYGGGPKNNPTVDDMVQEALGKDPVFKSLIGDKLNPRVASDRAKFFPALYTQQRPLVLKDGTKVITDKTGAYIKVK